MGQGTFSAGMVLSFGGVLFLDDFFFAVLLSFPASAVSS